MPYNLVSVGNYREIVKMALAAYSDRRFDLRFNRRIIANIVTKVTNENPITEHELDQLERISKNYDKILKLNNALDDKFRRHASDVLRRALDYLDLYDGGRKLVVKKNLMRYRLRQIEDGYYIWSGYFDSVHDILGKIQEGGEVLKEEEPKLEALVEELHKLVEITRIA